MSSEGKRAYFTLVKNDPWVVGALVLGYSLRKSETSATLVCQVGDGVSNSSRRRLEALYDEVEPAEEYQFPESNYNNFGEIPERLAFSFRRLNAWCRTEFERITYLDSDLMVMRNIDSLFDVPGLAAPRELNFRVWIKGKIYTDFFNGGLVSFSPSIRLFQRFADTLAARWVYLGAAEQHLVNVVCRKDWFRIPDRYHIQAGSREHVHFLDNPDRIRTLHFSKISKPWDKRYSGHRSLWPSWRRFANIWIEWLRNYETEYSDSVIPHTVGWETANRIEELRGNAGAKPSVEMEPATPTKQNQATRMQGTPTKLAEVAVFKGAFQKMSELRRLVALLRRRKLRTVVEIGTWRGGTLWLWCQLATDSAQVISIDLPNRFSAGSTQQGNLHKCAMPSQRLRFIRNDSQKEATREQLVRLLDGDGIDFLFIDGDHRYEAVRRDFEMYSSLMRPGGVVAFHDIVYHPRFPNSQVHRYWQELKRDYRVNELVDLDDERGWGQWGGIGVVYIR